MQTSNAPGGPASPDVVLSILMPVYNERATIRQVLEKVRAVDFGVRTELVVVDDGSQDGSGKALDALPRWENVHVFHHERNAGKGSAIQTALRQACGRYVVIQDADLELDPRDMLPLFDVVRSGRAVVCYGSRFMGDRRHLQSLPTYWANRFLTLICNLLNGQHLTDMNTCYKMMRADVTRRINLVSRGFDMEPEITTKLGRMGVRIVECPISYQPRSAAEGKKIKAVDLVRYLAAMVRFRLSMPAGPSKPVPLRSPPPRAPNSASTDTCVVP